MSSDDLEYRFLRTLRWINRHHFRAGIAALLAVLLFGLPAAALISFLVVGLFVLPAVVSTAPGVPPEKL